MSLTSQLKNARSPLRGWFEETLPDLPGMQADVRRACASVPAVVPAAAASCPWGDVGTAFDQRAGLALAEPDLAIAERGASAIVAAVEREHGTTAADRTAAAVTAFLDEHRRRCAAVGLTTSRPSISDERGLVRDAYVVALLEVGYRTPV